MGIVVAVAGVATGAHRGLHERGRPTLRRPRLASSRLSILLCLAPFAPHLCEELWTRLGQRPSIFNAHWPESEESIAAEDALTIVFQVNGKLRSKKDLPADVGKEQMEREALADPRVQEALDGSEPTRVIVVPRKLVNVVVKK